MKQFYVMSLLVLLLPTTVWAAKNPPAMKEDNQHVLSWNRFFDSLVKLHDWNQQQFDIRQTSSKAGYAGQPEFYREVQYHDKKSARLLSKVQWVKAKTDTIHTIEIFIYDEQGRVIRDYLAAYLPVHRNAPIQTLINFHHYNDELHSFRQFDASGNHIYEQCRGKFFNEPVMISTDEDDFDTAYGDEAGQTSMETYLACFEMLPKQAGRFKEPYTAEISRKAWQANVKHEISLTSYDEMDKMIKSLSAQLIKQPNNTRLYISRADAWFKLHEFDKAVTDYNQALLIDKDNSQAWFGRGMAYGRMGQIDKGIADLSEFLKLNPKSSRGYTKRGVRYLWQGEREKAEQDFKQAIRIDPDNAEANDDLGVIYAQRGELEQAIKHFSTTIQVDPTYQKGFHNLAMARHLGGEHKQALNAANKALALKADARETLLLKSQILTALGQHQQAKAINNEAEFLPEGNWSELAPN